MSEAIEHKNMKGIMSAAEVWNDLELIRTQFAPTLNEAEFKFFVAMGMQLKANPFKREIFAYKPERKPTDREEPKLAIMIGRDFYFSIAKDHPGFDGLASGSVYENDKFVVTNGVPSHEMRLANRGELIGAYACVYMKEIKLPFFRFVLVKEYHRGNKIWNEKPDTMIVKVAEAQALRAAMPDRYNGTYSEAEDWTQKQEPVKEPWVRSTPELPALEAEPIEQREPGQDDPDYEGGLKEQNNAAQNLADTLGGKVEETEKPKLFTPDYTKEKYENLKYKGTLKYETLVAFGEELCQKLGSQQAAMAWLLATTARPEENKAGMKSVFYLKSPKQMGWLRQQLGE